MKLQALALTPSNTLSPYFSVPVPAGPATVIEQVPEWINIHQYLRGQSEEISYLRAYGDSMQDDRIEPGDLLVVDRVNHASTNDVVIAEVNGEFTVKRLKQHSTGLYLVPANDSYPLRQIKRSDTFRVWAKVKHVIHSF